MMPARKLVLRRERLTDLTHDELTEVVGGASLSVCLVKTFTEWATICWCPTN